MQQHNRIRSFGIAVVSTIFLCQSGCSQEPVEEVVIDLDAYHMVKHAARTMTKDQWKAEVWVGGTEAPVTYPIDVYIRLTPLKAKNDKAAKAPKAKVKLAVLKGEEMIRHADLQPVFSDCRKMREGTEVTYFGDGKWGKEIPFPPKDPAWQTVIVDPFNSDRRKSMSVPFQPGNYHVRVSLELDRGPKFTFKDIPQKLSVR